MILKLHGAIDRAQRQGGTATSSPRTTTSTTSSAATSELRFPFLLVERMEESHFLFLGYSMHDWNLRVILNRIWGGEQLDLKSWAVQRAPADAGAREVEEALWRDRGDVDLLYVPLAGVRRHGSKRELFRSGSPA